MTSDMTSDNDTDMTSDVTSDDTETVTSDMTSDVTVELLDVSRELLSVLRTKKESSKGSERTKKYREKQKSLGNISVSITIKKELHERIKSMASAGGFTLGQQIEKMLETIEN